MICFNCGSKQDAVFFKEEFPCAHCNEINVIEYNLCPDCGLMWKSVNGIPIGDSQMNMHDLGDLAEILASGPDSWPKDIDVENISTKANEYLEKLEKMDRGEASMGDYIHRCIKCDSTAVDVNDGRYKCTDCGFEWEVVKFE